MSRVRIAAKRWKRGIAQVERGDVYSSADVLRIIRADGAQPVVFD